MESVFYQSLGVSKKNYAALLQGFQKRAGSIPVDSGTELIDLVSGVLNDHPELFFVAQEVKISSRLLKQEVIPYYIYPPAETEKVRARVEDAARQVIQTCINDHQSDYDKVRSLHDYLKTAVTYASEAVNNYERNNRLALEAHSIAGALLNRRCVCEGFAKTLKFLCDKIGLECWVVTGTANNLMSRGPHAWNIVRINGYYHHVDITWDNQNADNPEMPNYGYLNLCDDEIARDHTWERRRFPACPSAPYNYFSVNNALVDCQTQLINLLSNSFLSEEEYIMFRVVRGSRLEQEIGGCLQDCIEKAAARCRHISIASFRCSSIPEQMVYCVRPEYKYH